MTVLRIVPNIAAKNIDEATRFYVDILGMTSSMDLGWIATYSSGEVTRTQISFATEGGSGTPVPDLSIEVDNVDDIYQRAKSAEMDIPYEITNEPWGARRFYVRDPFGKLINVLQHISN